MSADHRRDRKKKRLLVYGVASLVAAATTAGTLALAAPGLLGSDGAGAAAADVPLQARFAQAAEEFDVPQSVLMAVSYRQTRWEDHDGLPSTTGAYNVMGLTDVDPESLEDGAADEREHQLEHMNRSGDPAVEKNFDAEEALASLDEQAVDTSDPRLHTLDEAAGLIDASPEQVRSDPGESIRAGAALLAEYQQAATGSLPEDPGAWYPAVARASQATDHKGAELFAKRVFESIRTGERRVTADGQSLTLPADPAVEPDRGTDFDLAGARTAGAAAAPDCPTGLNCDFRPAAYKQNGALDDWGNYAVASRPEAGHEINSILLHDTEGSYQSALGVFQNPKTYASAHYLIRASDGLVTQMVENRNEAWHAGNKSLNMHSIGIEHEGYAIKDGSWYTEPQYESSAALVKHLAGKYGIPLDREHIIGHDEVPGVLDAKVKAQHWDPGPFWDWNHYMDLLGAPTGAQGPGGPYRAGQVIGVVPPFTTANQPKLTNGGAAVPAQPANFTYLYSSPSTTSATLTDPYLGSQTSTEGWNWANKVVAGGEYVVAEARQDWTAIWYGGKKAWFRNKSGQFATAAGTPDVITPKAGAGTVPVYGRTYPEDAAYTGTGVPVQDDNTASLTKYGVLAGQKYTLAGSAIDGSYYNSGNIDGSGEGSRTVVVGDTAFYPIRYNHRLAWVRVSDVQVVKGTAPDPGTDRYDILGRDASGVLWQYQGTGSATAPFFGRFRIGGGWNAYDAVTTLTALRADGTGDAVARDKSGVLWYYQGSGDLTEPFRKRTRVGGGWSVYDTLTGARDLTGDGRADLVARDRSGVLWLYRGTGNATAPFESRSRIGGGWSVYNTLTDTGDLTGDGRADLVARDKSGVLWLYRGTGNATAPFESRSRIGGGWSVYNTLNGPSDLNRDGRPDLVARDKDGVLWFYQGTGGASAPFKGRTKVGGGWDVYDTII
ncbi:N-acetylmuramoyl-L-alanine amidase [Streptomyces ambofaciens]|uniref:N-acetylmuramoyl-L-alanine amidase n=1 Tax=Streptomyces ambofaciens TaxID=1889 RepID=A0ABN4P4G5_STRAM|nr:N-acetylmuramoyl-L-alanine amidase [Streptomyces ambofaciens]ANB05974.1 N-acetylmuramoyl-L-alanine amidase [Streptomyces ambofaciens]